MNVDLFITPAGVNTAGLLDKTIIVIDVLRASTTICHALANGCKEIIPAGTVEQALQIAARLDKDATLVGGERDGVKLEGFDLGNSPREYDRTRVKNKSIILTTTNGSIALTKSRSGNNIYTGSFCNMSVLVNRVNRNAEDLCIICAGDKNRFALEDATCGGMIITMLRDLVNGTINCTDSAYMAELLYSHYKKDIPTMITESTWGRYLESIGQGSDLPICAAVDSVEIIPAYQDGTIQA